MRIEKIDQAAVVVSLSPADCFLLAEACREVGQDRTERHGIAQGHPFTLAAAHLESLALVGAAQGYVTENSEFLAQWTLPGVRRAWPLAAGTEEEPR